MAQVMLDIGGRPHAVACRDGEESRVRLLGAMVAERWATADRAAGGLSAERAMLFVALMLADDLDEAAHRPPEGSAVSEIALTRIADRLEGLAQALEQSPLELGPPSA
ncbi:cell division protein ZapA [Sphingomonas sp. M1A8_2b]